MLTRTIPHAALFVLVMLLAVRADAQRLTISTIDTTKFPVISARVYPLDRDGQLIDGLVEGDFRVLENGARRDIFTLRCTPPAPDQPLSTVLTIDVSGSMASGGAVAGTPNMDLARGAAFAWIDGMPEGSESAVTIFDHGSLIVQDFTQDRDLLRASILALSPNGGTNYNAGLVKPPSGSLAIADKGRFKRVVIFLTDGRGRGNEREIIAEATRIGATIFCVTLGMPAPEMLKNVARRTGGEYYENVSTMEDARAVYRAILFRAMGGEPCELSWLSEAACTVEREVAIEVLSEGIAAVEEYSAPASSIARLDIEPPAITFGTAPPGTQLEATVTLTALNRDVNISRIAPIGLPGQFTLTGLDAPMTLRSGERRTLTVRFTAPDSNYHFTRWRIDNDACFGGSLFASAGVGNPPAPSIRVVHPNGGERFSAGEITDITWDGIRPSDTVRIEYSTNAGTTWTPVVDRAGGLSYRWRVPATPSERCLARVALVPPGPTRREDAQQLTGHTQYMTTSAFSPDGRRIAGSSWDGSASIWDVGTGRLLQKLVASRPTGMGASAQRVYYVEFSADGSRVLTADEGEQIRIWDATSGRLLRSIEGSLYKKPDMRGRSNEGDVAPDRVLSADGRRAIVKVNNVPTVVDVESGRKLMEVTGHTAYVVEAIFSPDGSQIATASQDSTVAIWRVPSGALVQRLKLGDPAEAITWSPDGSMIATSSYEDRGMIQVWSARNGDKVLDVPIGKAFRSERGMPRALFHPDGQRLMIWAGSAMTPTLIDLSGNEIAGYDQDGEGSVGYAVFNPDGRYVATSNGYNIKVYDTERGTLLNEIRIDAQASYAAFSPDGTRIAGALGDTLGVWQSNRMAVQQDVSDSLWAIVVDTKPSAVDVDFGRRAVGVPADSVVSAYIRNDGTRAMRVDDISFTGANAKEFSLVSGIPPFEVAPGESRQVEFEFLPARVGQRRANVVINAGGQTLTKSIRGEAVEPQLTLELTEVDFDSVEVGDSRDSLVAVALTNTGDVPVEVRRTPIGGPDSTSFEVVDGGGPFTIAPGASHAMTLRFAPSERGRTSTLLRFEHSGIGNAEEAYLYGEGVGNEYRDPTTFRTIVTPNAIIPKGGTFVAASYDIVGLMVGYVPTDNVMILAGGAVPLPDDWGSVNGNMYGAIGLGIKAGVEVMDRLNVAGGVIYGRSIYDNESTPDTIESVIGALTPFAAVSYGDDDSRVSATYGYAFKTHRVLREREFERNASALTIGGDYRFANRWKVAAEVITLETLGYVPVALTARYFGRTWALDLGLAFRGIKTNAEVNTDPVVLPVVSWVMVF